LLLTWRYVIFRNYRLDRALGFAQGAIDTLVRIDYEEVRPFVKTVDRANIDTIHVLAFDAIFENHKCH
jgi:hypothetical protein